MMIFMGVMFFKVACGLCLYFIASSLWGITERKLLPKSTLASPPVDAAGKSAVAVRSDGGNGAAGGKKRQTGRK
jgi:YidC/Oxa1 family membrane protein insertase